MELFGDTQLGHVFLRTAIMFLVALVIVRLMGSRTLGQMTPFDYVILVGIGDIVATVALDTDEKLWVGAEALIMLLILDFVLSYLSLKNIKIRYLIEGTPVPLIKDGQVIRQNLSKAHFNNNDLKQEMHKLGMEMEDIKDVKQAWLEGCGHFTVVTKKSDEPVTLEDMQNIVGSSVQPGQLPSTVISQATLEQLVDSVNRLIQAVKEQQSTNGQTAQTVSNIHSHDGNNTKLH
jgi:uncharacterized membrane protein YcaP (DUF421 family)